MRRLSDLPLARTGLILAALGAVGLALVGVGATAAGPAAPPTTASVSGVVFYDRNDDGVRQADEPGLAGLRVHDKAGDLSTVTSPTGGYALSGLPVKGYLQVETGWFRSQCPPAADPTAMSCAAGADNAFEVDNQFVRYPLTAAGDARADVGLLPDWPDASMTVPAPVDGVVPANAVDVAARLSADNGTCADGAYVVCRAGDRFTMGAQVFNQGTTALTGVTARLSVPPGDCATSVKVLAFTVPDGLGPVTATPAAPTCATRYVTLAFGGVLAPAAGVRVSIGGRVAGGPGTPGCTVREPAGTCPRSEPQGRGWLFGVSHIDQDGDPDSEFCAAGDMSTCPIGLHDKRRAPDEIDPAGHNVDAALGGSRSYDLVARATGWPSDGAAITLRAWTTNPGPNASPSKVTVKAWFPAGTQVLRVPPPHVLIRCDRGATEPAGVVVTCVLGAPVAPGLGSPAADITVMPPVGRSDVTARVCVAPPAGAAPESVRAAVRCDENTSPTATATNNDARADLRAAG
jgi:hypothetical protein